jgi:hypothetical protein
MMKLSGLSIDALSAGRDTRIAVNRDRGFRDGLHAALAGGCGGERLRHGVFMQRTYATRKPLMRRGRPSVALVLINATTHGRRFRDRLVALASHRPGDSRVRPFYLSHAKPCAEPRRWSMNVKSAAYAMVANIPSGGNLKGWARRSDVDNERRWARHRKFRSVNFAWLRGW